MKFQLLHRAVKGTPVVSLNTVTRAVHIRLLARQIHNARMLLTAAASRPARLRRSLPAASLLFPSPTAPCVTTVTRTRLLACRRTSGQPKDGWCGSVDVVPDHDDEQPDRLRPRAAVDPAPPTITRTTTSFATKVSPAWTPNALSLIGHQNRTAIYSCQCGLIRESCLDSSSLIDWLWFWLMDFLPQVSVNKLLLTDVVIWTVENSFSCSWCYNFSTVNSWKA
jgi:hypothetical protein